MRGYSLIEILVSLSILSFMLLSYDAMQFRALYEASVAHREAIALNQLTTMEQIIQSAAPNRYSREFTLWNKDNQAQLPHGEGRVLSYASKHVIELWWGDHPEKACRENQIGMSGCLRAIVEV